jgi:hypothetical protein
MNARVTRPLLGIAIGGALLLGSGFIASPASASDARTAGSAVSVPSGHPGGFVATPDRDRTAASPRRLSARADLAAGSYTLSTGAAWVGQTVTLTELSVSADTVTRTVNWGDGSDPVTLAAGQTSVTRSYGTAGDYTVSVALTGTDGTTTDATVDQPVLSISTPGTVTLNQTAVWLGQTFRLSIDGVQTDVTSKIVLTWGDGYTSTFPGRSGYIDSYYYHRQAGSLVGGTVHLKAEFFNKLGSVTVPASIVIRTDLWRPSVTINHPANSNRASSWASVGGTTTDKGSGTRVVWVLTSKVVGKSTYCFNGTKKTWSKVKSINSCYYYGQGVLKGKWMMRLKGVAKGSTVTFATIASDWGDSDSKIASYRVTITK